MYFRYSIAALLLALHVHATPISLQAELEQYGVEGSIGTIRCEASGAPRPRMIWRSPNGRITEGHKYYIVSDRLLISNVQKSDEGLYTCEAMQLQTGRIESVEINYHVQESTA